MKFVPPRLSTVALEAVAFVRQATLLAQDSAPVLPLDPQPGDDVVVFLHGLFASAGVLRPMRRAVERHAAAHSASLSYPPGPGIEAVTRQLRSLLARLPREVRVHLVGHSLGGLVARFAAVSSDDERICQTISLAAPFAGIPRARHLGFGAARDLDPGSPLLRTIAFGYGPRAAAVPHLSIVGAEDAMLTSPVAHALPGGDVIVLDGRGHNALLFDDDAASIVAERIVAARARRRPAEPITAAES